MNISKEYQDNLLALHKKKSFGARASIPGKLKTILNQYKFNSVLDYGCGKGQVVEAIKNQYNINIYGYDPGNPFYSYMPDSVDLTYSLDVLEHIEPEHLEETLNDLANRTNQLMYHSIACHLAKKTLPDGRNAHLIVEDPLWWQSQLKKLKNFTIVDESVDDYIKTLRKGPDIRVIKYGVLLKRNA